MRPDDRDRYDLRERQQREFSNAEADGPVRGVRTFLLDGSNNLYGRWGVVWSTGEQVARCGCYNVATPHEDVLGPECGGGFYGYFELPEYQGSTAYVHAVIEASGSVLIGTEGFRATRAELLGIAPNTNLDSDVLAHVLASMPAVGERYGIPVLGDVDELLSVFPTTYKTEGNEDQWGEPASDES